LLTVFATVFERGRELFNRTLTRFAVIVPAVISTTKHLITSRRHAVMRQPVSFTIPGSPRGSRLLPDGNCPFRGHEQPLNAPLRVISFRVVDSFGGDDQVAVVAVLIIPFPAGTGGEGQVFARESIIVQVRMDGPGTSGLVRRR
jgi:hypothetical protein